jgi:mannitol-1-phosphate/altronate dehydrogenase
LLTLSVAGWFRYLAGRDDQRSPIEVVDPMATTLQRLAAIGGTDPRPLLASHASLQQLGEHPTFVAGLQRACESLERGAHHAIAEQLSVGAMR